MSYQDDNAAAITRWVEEGWEWGKPISHETYMAARKGQWDVKLTPTKAVPHEWFGELRGKKLLGLASGGGQQMPVFAALGAECTVLDYTEQMARLNVGDDGVQFSHTFEEQIGGQLEAGFRLTHVYEDTNGEGKLHEFGVPTFWATRAVKE